MCAVEILRAENLTFTYPDQTDKALDNVSFSVQRGEFVTLCGKSGSGPEESGVAPGHRDERRIEKGREFPALFH